MISLTKIDKKSVKIMVLGSLLLVVVFIMGVSYAYTHANFFNVENSTTIAVNGGKMEIVYNDPNGGGYSSSIIADEVIPGWETTKLFTVTGTNEIDSNQTVDTNMYYKVGLVVEENTFSEGALKYELASDNGDVIPTGQVLNKLTGNVPQAGTEWFGMGYFVSGSDAVVHKYALKISFPETGQNQNIDKGKHFAGYVTITDEGEFVNLNVIVDSESPELNYNLRLLKNSGIFLETPVREGQVFKEWTLASGDAIVEGNKIKVFDEDVVLKAVWEETTKYVTLAIDLDGGTSEIIQLNQSVLTNSGVVLDIPIKDGYVFSNWEVISGDAFVSSQTMIVIGEKNSVIKAIWRDVVPVFTYLKNDGSPANYTLIKETRNDWKIKFLESGNLNFSDLGNAKDGIDVFLVGGGGAGGYYVAFGTVGAGGGGGYTTTQKKVFIETTTYQIVVGAGGSAGGSGGTTSAFALTANGGFGGGKGTIGGSGGSGGGGSGGGFGGSDGSNGYSGSGNYSGSGGVGQGTTTREFGETVGTLYSGGGGGCAFSGDAAGGAGGGGQSGAYNNNSGCVGGSAGITNTGGGGGAGGGSDGGSGIVIIRNARS